MSRDANAGNPGNAQRFDPPSSTQGQCREALARAKASSVPSALRTTEGSWTPSDSSSVQQPKTLRVRCPHCHSPMQLVQDSSVTDIVCPSCKNRFGLLSKPPTATYHALSSSETPHSKWVAHFELVEQVGMGSFGTVWKARDTLLDRTVAVKIPRKGELDPAETERFLREARASAQIRHPNIVSVHEVGCYAQSVYIVSDFVEGLSLKDWLTDQRLSPREAAQICVKIADALHEAHEAGVVHRDLKPGNIMLDLEGEPYLTDFGLAKRETDDITMTVDGKIVGTPAYMSPEQARGRGHEADARSDVYSLGVVLYELLTGEVPFRGERRMLIPQILDDEPPRPGKLNSHIPRDLETICLKCLEKDPSRRYHTALAVADDLRRCLKGATIRARPVGHLERGWRWCKRNPVVSGLAIGLVMAVFVGVIGVTSQWIRAEAEAQTKGRLAHRNAILADLNATRARQEQAKRKQAELRYRHMREDILKALTAAESNQRQRAFLDVLHALDQMYENEESHRPSDLDWQCARGYLLLRLSSLNEQGAGRKHAEMAYRDAADIFGRLATQHPGLPRLQELLGETRMKLGVLYHETGGLEQEETQFRAAERIFSGLVDEYPEVAQYRNYLAIVQLWLNDNDAYARTCQSMLEQFGASDNDESRNLTVRTCVLAPHAVENFQRIVEAAAKNVHFPDLFGAAMYRVGEYGAAVQRLRESAEVLATNGASWNWLFLAMSHHRLGQSREARASLNKAVERMDRTASQAPGSIRDASRALDRQLSRELVPWREALELEVLRREAEALLEASSDLSP